jgi:MFS transporter, NNP family, nitrate/nitrite transporter
MSAAASFRSGALNFNTWLLFVHYACCFGVELTMNNDAALYFKEEFGLSTESAAAIASIFGWMNLFVRGLAGFVSDKLNAHMGMHGRLLTRSDHHSRM